MSTAASSPTAIWCLATASAARTGHRLPATGHGSRVRRHNPIAASTRIVRAEPGGQPADSCTTRSTATTTQRRAVARGVRGPWPLVSGRSRQRCQASSTHGSQAVAKGAGSVPARPPVAKGPPAYTAAATNAPAVPVRSARRAHQYIPAAAQARWAMSSSRTASAVLRASSAIQFGRYQPAVPGSARKGTPAPT